MINLDIGPRETVIGALLEVECVELVRLSSGARHQPIEHSGITFDPRANEQT